MRLRVVIALLLGTILANMLAFSQLSTVAFLRPTRTPRAAFPTFTPNPIYALKFATPTPVPTASPFVIPPPTFIGSPDPDKQIDPRIPLGNPLP